MAFNISFSGYNPAATPVYAMIRKVSAGVEGDWWDDTNTQFVASPAATDREISLTAGAGIFASVFTGSSSGDLETYTGTVRVFIVDNSTTAGYVVGSYDVDVNSGVEVDPDLVDETGLTYAGVETNEAQSFVVKVFNPSSGAGSTAAVSTTTYGTPGDPPTLAATSNAAAYSGSPGIYTVSMTAAELNTLNPVLVRVTTADGGTGDAVLVFGARDIETDWADGGRLDLILDTISSNVSTIKDTTLTDLDLKIDGLPTAAQTADAVWNETISEHVTAGSAGDRLERLDMFATGGAGEITAAIAGNLVNLDAAITSRATANDVNSEVQSVIEANHLDHLFAVAYDAGAKPGNAAGLLNEMVEDDGGLTRFTVNALENAAGSGLEASNVAAAVWDKATVDHSIAGSFGELSAKITAIQADTDELQTAFTTGGTLEQLLQGACTSVEVSALNDLSVADVNGVVTSYGLDHLVSTAAGALDVADNSIVGQMAAADGTWSSFQASTDSLQALRDQGDSAWATAAGFSTHSALDVVTAMDGTSTKLAAIEADTNELQTDWANGGRLDLLLDATSTHSAGDVRVELDANSTKLGDIYADSDYLQQAWSQSPAGTLYTLLAGVSSANSTVSTNVDDIETTLSPGGTIHTMINNISATPNTLSAEFINESRTFRFEPDQPKARNVVSVAVGDNLTLAGDFDRVLNFETDLATASSVTVVEGDAGDLTLGTPEVSQDHEKIHCKISGWVTGKRYVLRFAGTTTDGDTISGDGVVKVR